MPRANDFPRDSSTRSGTHSG